MLGRGEFAAFSAPPRPASRITQGVIEWGVPLKRLRGLHEAAAAKDVGGSASI